MVRKRKPNLKKLKSEADKLWKVAVFRRWGNQCLVCGSGFMIDPHHFIPKRISLSLRYDIENGVPLCRKCHTELHWKSDPMINLVIAFKKGKEWIEYLKEQKDKKIISNRKWYEEIINSLKKEEVNNLL